MKGNWKCGKVCEPWEGEVGIGAWSKMAGSFKADVQITPHRTDRLNLFVPIVPSQGGECALR